MRRLLLSFVLIAACGVTLLFLSWGVAPPTPVSTPAGSDSVQTEMIPPLGESPARPAAESGSPEPESPPSAMYGRVTGRVVLGPRRSTAGTVVRIAKYADPGDRPDTPNWFEPAVDDKGEFTVEGLRPGRYGLRVSPAGLPPIKLGFSVPPEGGTVSLDDIVSAAGGSIIVRVLRPGGKPVLGEQISISTGPGRGRWRRTADAAEPGPMQAAP